MSRGGSHPCFFDQQSFLLTPPPPVSSVLLPDSPGFLRGSPVPPSLRDRRTGVSEGKILTPSTVPATAFMNRVVANDYRSMWVDPESPTTPYRVWDFGRLTRLGLLTETFVPPVLPFLCKGFEVSSRPDLNDSVRSSLVLYSR